MTTELLRNAVEDFGSPVGEGTLHCRCWRASYGNCIGCIYKVGCRKYLALLRESYKLNAGMSSKKFDQRMRGILFAKNEEQLRAMAR